MRVVNLHPAQNLGQRLTALGNELQVRAFAFLLYTFASRPLLRRRHAQFFCVHVCASLALCMECLVGQWGCALSVCSTYVVLCRFPCLAWLGNRACRDNGRLGCTTENSCCLLLRIQDSLRARPVFSLKMCELVSQTLPRSLHIPQSPVINVTSLLRECATRFPHANVSCHYTICRLSPRPRLTQCHCRAVVFFFCTILVFRATGVMFFVQSI